MLKVLSLAALLGTTVTAQAETSPVQKEEIKKIVGEYIKENPQEIIASLQEDAKKQEQAALKKIQDGVAGSKDQLSDSKNAIVVGKADAAVKLVIFVDPNCPHCRIFESALVDIEKELPVKDKLGVLIRQWPILGENSKNVSAGLIAAYAQDSKKFTDLSTKLLNSKEAMDQDKFMTIAKEIGFDSAKLEAAMKSDAVMTQLKNTKELAEKIGLDATPTIILSDKSGARLIQVGDKEGLKKLLSDAIKAS